MKLKIVLAATVLVTGCATASNEKWATKVRLIEPDVVVDTINEARTPDGVMQIGVSAHSNSMFDQNIKYRVVWFDNHNMELTSSVSAWVKRSLTSSHPFDFTASAPSDRAKTYKIEFDDQ